MASIALGLSAGEWDELSHWLHPLVIAPGGIVFSEGDAGNAAYFVIAGELRMTRSGRLVRVLRTGDVFGEVALLDGGERTGTVMAVSDARLMRLDAQDLASSRFPPRLAAALMKRLGRRMAHYLRFPNQFYQELDVLLVQDGGCAPGYNTVTSFLCQFLERSGRQVFVAQEGFRSLVQGRDEDFGVLLSDATMYAAHEGIRGVHYAPLLRDQRGAAFRSERYPEFARVERQLRAAQVLAERRVKVLVTIGGNGTFAGTRSFAAHLPKEVQCFFVPVTIDSDVRGTECIGQHTGVEVGAEKIRCYLADAATHHRCYLVEMMGARGGYHALHACVGAGAHLAVLPGSSPELAALVRQIHESPSTVIVVAEGYARDLRDQAGFAGSAAHFLYEQLLSEGLDPSRRRVIHEQYSRDVRGALPNNLDITLAQLMAYKVAEMVQERLTRRMPTVNGGHVSSLGFAEIETDLSISSALAALAASPGAAPAPR